MQELVDVGFKRVARGVGYNSGGKYPQSYRVEGRKSAINTLHHKIWYNMINRCYGEEYHKLKPSYADCSVCPEWHDFQVFAEWLEKQPHWDDPTFHLDKDILNKGNKQYSPENCRIIPRAINGLFTTCGSARGDLPVGVTREKDRYRSRVMCFGKSISLGTYDTVEEAFESHKIGKEAHVKVVASKYLDGDYTEHVDMDVYNALMKHEVEIGD